VHACVAASALAACKDTHPPTHPPTYTITHPPTSLLNTRTLTYIYTGYNAILVVPTGINAAIGGYAGDAMPVAKGLASVCDTLITHPNVMNGASLYAPQDNILYTEG
jgi:hypothetical protein